MIQSLLLHPGLELEQDQRTHNCCRLLSSPVPQQKEASITPDLGCSKGVNEGKACSFSVPAGT